MICPDLTVLLFSPLFFPERRLPFRVFVRRASVRLPYVQTFAFGKRELALNGA